MNPIMTLGTVLGLSFTAGINLYATVLTVGLAIRNGWVSQYPAGLEALGSDPVIAIAGVMYACEFCADKIPGFDSVWDGIQTFFRPIGGAALAFAATGHADPGYLAAATLLGGTVATATHLSKASARLVINTSPEPVSNWVASSVEDVGAFGIAWLAMVHPIVALIVVTIIGITTIVTAPVLIRYARFLLSMVWGRIRGISGGRTGADFLPGECLALIGSNVPPSQALRAYQRGPGIGRNRSGFIVLGDDAIVCLYRRWFQWRQLRLSASEIQCVRLERRFLSSTVEIVLSDGRIFRAFIGRDRDLPAARFAETARCGSPPAAESTHLMVPSAV